MDSQRRFLPVRHEGRSAGDPAANAIDGGIRGRIRSGVVLPWEPLRCCWPFLHAGRTGYTEYYVNGPRSARDSALCSASVFNGTLLFMFRISDGTKVATSIEPPSSRAPTWEPSQAFLCRVLEVRFVVCMCAWEAGRLVMVSPLNRPIAVIGGASESCLCCVAWRSMV